MKRLFTTLFSSLMLAPVAALAVPTQTYLNPAGVLVSSQVVVDAINFINLGSWNIGVLPYTPYESFDTLNYTNAGSMTSTPGWRFDLNSTETGLRSWSANFVNINPGVITALDTDNVGTSPIGNPCVIARVDPSYLLISATNIVARAGGLASGSSLAVGPNGELRLEGQSVDLTRSGLEVLPVWDEILPQVIVTPPTSFVPDIAVYDQVWAAGQYSQNFPLNTRNLWNGSTATAPGNTAAQAVAPSTAFGGFTFPIIGSSTADSFVQDLGGSVTITNFMTVTNVITDTNCTPSVTITNIDQLPLIMSIPVRSNVVKGAVFVGVPPEFNVPQIGFSPTVIPNNPAAGFPAYQEASVLISVNISNAVTGLFEPAYIRIDDTLASDTAVRGVAPIPNQVGCGAATDRPRSYVVDRQPIITGLPGNNGFPDANFLVSSSSDELGGANIFSDLVTNPVVVAGNFAAYAGLFDNIVTRPPAVPGGSVVTNTPGRVTIKADSLDMTRARIRGEGAVRISTLHLISSKEAVVDVENLSYDLSSTNGGLRIENLVNPSGFVQRMRGSVQVWSAIWQAAALVQAGPNYIFTNIPVMSSCTNVVIGTNTVVLGQTNVSTTVAVYFQVLMVDATALTTVVPVNVYDLVTHSVDTIVNDNMTVVQSLLIDGKSFTLNGGITIPGAFPPNPLDGSVPGAVPLFDWKAVNAPSLLYFTNNGTLSIFNEGHFGDDRPSPYSVFRNTGILSSGSIGIRSINFENDGTLSSTFGLTVQNQNGKLQNGSSSSGGDTSFFSQNLKFNQFQLSAGAALNFHVTNNLSDTGGGSANTLQAQDGINLLIKPLTGDLLGTTMQTLAPSVPSVQVDHSWAGQDRGPSPAGYVNDVALGRLNMLSLSPDPLFHFRGTGAHNAMYVDLLDLSALTDYTNQIEIDNNLVIYYAAALLPSGFLIPPNTNGVEQEPEEYLDGQFGGHLRWVPTFAGPNSSVTNLVNGQSTAVNRALFNSKIIDSDGDGVPNFYDVIDTNGPFLGAQLTVNVAGNGTVLPDYGGQLLLVGQSYTLSAQPGDGADFGGWSGSVTSAAPLLTFTMTNGLTFTASFAAVLSPGSYNGLFFEDVPIGVEFLRSGAISVTTAKGGKCSGVVEIGKNRFSFTGQLDTNGIANVAIPKGGLVLHMQFGSNQVTGTIGDGATWTANLLADRATFNAKTNLAPQAGSYTLKLPGTGNPTNTLLPQGDGWFTVTVDLSGKIKMSGTLPDNTPVSDSSTLSADGRWPLFINLYNGGGQLLGWIQFGDNGEQDLGGTVSWIKQPNAKAKFYPGGFNIETNAAGSVYDSTISPVTGFSNGEVNLAGGNLAGNIANDISVGPDNKVANLSTNKLTLTITTKSGAFKGTVVDPATGKTIKYNGVLFQKDGTGSGAFFGTDQSGKVDISH